MRNIIKLKCCCSPNQRAKEIVIPLSGVFKRKGDMAPKKKGQGMANCGTENISGKEKGPQTLTNRRPSQGKRELT